MCREDRKWRLNAASWPPVSTVRRWKGSDCYTAGTWRARYIDVVNWRSYMICLLYASTVHLPVSELKSQKWCWGVPSVHSVSHNSSRAQLTLAFAARSPRYSGVLLGSVLGPAGSGFVPWAALCLLDCSTWSDIQKEEKNSLTSSWNSFFFWMEASLKFDLWSVKVLSRQKTMHILTSFNSWAVCIYSSSKQPMYCTKCTAVGCKLASNGHV